MDLDDKRYTSTTVFGRILEKKQERRGPEAMDRGSQHDCEWAFVEVVVDVNDHVNDHGHVDDHAGSRLRLLTGSCACLFAVTDRAAG